MTLLTRQREMLRLAIVVLSLSCVPLCVQAADVKRPNILFIIVDDQSPFDLKVYQPTSALHTPNIDRLAADGMVFDGAYHMGSFSGAVCTPSRHMVMCGRTLWHLPIAPGAIKQGKCPPNIEQQTIPAVFNRAGYSTMRTCKIGNSYEAANKLFTVRHDATKRGGDDESGSAWHGEQVLNYLKERATSKDERPFLIYFGFSHPHDTRDGTPELLAKYGAVNHADKNSLPPANPKQPVLPVNYLPAHPFPNGHPGLRDEVDVSGVWERRDEQTIRNELGREFSCGENIDIQIGRVLKKLEAMGELGNTYIVYTADHGMAIGRHGLQGKQNLYQHTWRVPFIVKGPGIKAGTRVEGNIYLLDTLSTLCDLAGIQPPETSEGISFKPVLEGKKSTVRDVLYGVYNGGTKPGMRCVKLGDWKLIKYDVLDGKVRETQLFNLKENPNEFLEQHHDPKVAALIGIMPTKPQVNLANDPAHADKLKEMEALLLAEMRRLEDPWRLWNQPDDRLGSPTDGLQVSESVSADKPNVLFIVIDDQNDWIGHLGGHPLAKTPHIDRLAARGTTFLNAHCQAPLCNPSRTSLMLSLRPTTTGVYGLAPWFRTLDEWKDRVALPQHFKAHGYRTLTVGKVYHGGVGGPKLREKEFDVWGAAGGIGVKPEKKLIPPTPMGDHPLMDWGVFPHEDEDKGDYHVASWAVEQIQSAPKDQPFFLATGFFLPHVPCYATQKWFDLYPDDDSVLPLIKLDDRNDTPRFSWYLHWNLPEPRLKWVRENHQWRNLVRSYLACMSFVDAQVGRLLDALDEARLTENTVVVLWGDHGWHLGEKAITGKNTLWDRGTRVPLVFAGPGIAHGGRCSQPAELLDIYPTLNELCRLTARNDLEGISLAPQLKDATAKRERPAITSHNQGNHGIRTERWRYIRYADGTEELYDMQNDPREWTNLATNTDFSAVIAEHRRWLPKTEVPPAPNSAHRVLTYDKSTDEAIWEGTTVRRSDPIPE